ncbi:uncharacterized protein [Apostichopus japonicus]|uniref:uncharacterized protein isoform X3 n=1 Tax=Stichopus japonicus TaxID=307972 RepID=UPI003AB31242
MTDEAGIGPSERQVNTLIFQQLCRFQIFDEKPETLSPKERFQLVAISAKYGYAFIGTNSATIKVIKIDDLVRISDERQESPGTTVSDYPHEKLSLSDKPLHIAVDCQEQVISVITKGDANLRVHIFDIVDVCKQASSAKAFLTTGLSKETDVDLIDLQWNPVTPSLFAVCLSDGTAELWTWSEGKLSLLSSLPQIFKADAFCWSPKGKQIVIGTNDGQLLQFTHNMEQKKIVPKPDFTNEAVKVVDILWISTFMWVVAYIDEEETVQPNLAIVHAPKEQPVSFINFEDICYGSGEDRKSRYYMKFLDKWGFVIASSGNSMETGILGHKPDVKTSWDVWTLEDTARVELPLCDSDDTFPMGFAVDFSSQLPFLAVNKQKLDPVPILLLLSSEGLLCPFHIINKESKESLQYRTEPLPTVGVSKGIAVRQTAMDGQPAGIGPQGSINLTTTTTGAMPPAPKPPTAQPSSVMPFSFKPPTQPGSTTQSGFSFSSTAFGRDGPVLSTAGSQVTQPTDDSRVPSTGAQTKPFSFSFQPSGVTSGTPPFSFAKAASSTTDAPSTSSFPSFTPPAPSTAQTVPFGAASSQGLFGSSSGVGQGTQSQGLFGSSTKTNQSQSSGTPFSFSKPAFSFNAQPGSTTSQASVPSTVASASGGQTSAPPAYPFARPSGSSDKPVAPSQPISGQAGPGQQTTGTLVAPTKAQGTVPPTSHAPVSNPPSVAPPNQVAPMMKSLPFVVTEEPQGASSQITLPKVQDVPKAPGNLSVTIPLEQRKSAMQAQRAAAAAAVQAQKQVYAPVVEPVSPVSSVSTSVGGEHLESALMSNILDEMEHFGKEIDGLKSRTRDGKYSIGNKEELRRIRKDMADLDSFKADVLECTKSLNEDVHSIKSKLLSSFALLEESRIRKQRNKDPKFITLLKARELDPQTASKMQEIRGMYHYLDVGSRDVNRSLDMEWEENQRRGNRNGSRKLATPTMDTVYHTLRNHHNIMASQRIALEDIREKLVRAQKYDPIGALYRGPLPSPRFRSDEVEPLALKLSETKLHSSRRERRTPASAKKQSLLRDILSRRTQTPMRSSPKVLSREEQVSSPTLSYSSEGSYTPSAPFSKKLDFTDDAGPDPTRGNQETKFQQAITPQRESTPVKDMTNGMPLKQTTMPPKQGMMPPAYPTTVMSHPVSVGGSTNIGRVPPVVGVASGNGMPPPRAVSSPTAVSQTGVTTTTAPSSFAHTGTGTVLWGADASKATPAQLAGAAALNRLPTKGQGASGEPTTSKLPPNVNIKNLDSLKSTMPPPVTFAAVASSVDTDTAQVVTQVLSEITATSGKSVPPPGTAVRDTPTVSSKPVEVPTVTSPFVQPSLSTGASSSVSSSKPSAVIAEAPKSGGALHTPVAASTPTDTATTVPQSTKFDFGTRNNNASTSVPGGFFLGGAVTENPTGASAVFGGRKAQTSQDTNQTPEAKDGTLKGLLEENPTDSKAPKSGPVSSTPQGNTASAAPPPAAPINFSFASSSSKFGFGGSNSGFSFSQKASTAPNAETSSAFGQSAAITATPSSQPSEAVNASTASTPVETEAAGPFVFPVSKPSIGTDSASGFAPGGTPNLFGGSTPSSSTPTSVSAAAVVTTSAVSNLAVSSATATSLFGNQAPTIPQTTSAFSFSFVGQATPVTVSAPSSGFSFAPTSSSGAIVSSTSATGTTPSLFATATTSAVPAQTTTDASGFSFASTSSGQSLFGGSGAGKPLFGSPATTTKPSLFGQPASTSAFAVSSSTTTSSGGGFSFGQPTTTSQSFFGQPTSTTQSVFGGQPSPFSTASASSPFGQKSAFGQAPVSSTTASTGLFSQPTASNTSAGPFGTSTPAATTASGQSTSGGVSFGGAFGLGGKPNPEAAKINPFGVAASTAGGSGLFGGTTTLFGGQGPKAFGSPTSSGGGGFGGSGSFSTNAGGVVAGGFGSASQTSTASSAFGGGPSFGGAPAFGGKPSFGSPSGFGTGAAFSNPLGQSTFGASPPSGSVFGASSSTMPNTPSAGFGGFASQNTPSFGGIASNSPPAFGTGGGGGGFGAAQTGGAFGGNTAFGGGFSSTQGSGFGNNNSNASFGAGSFSQYRN